MIIAFDIDMTLLDHKDYEIPNSAIAEYFVNLCMGYKLKIKANDFKKYCKTVLNKKLYPIYTAPGKQADFQYENYDTKEVYIVETTIHNNQNALTKNELEPTARHFYSFINKINDLIFMNDYEQYQSQLISADDLKVEFVSLHNY